MQILKEENQREDPDPHFIYMQNDAKLKLCTYIPRRTKVTEIGDLNKISCECRLKMYSYHMACM